MRDTKILQPILEQLIALELICFVKPARYSAVYIAMPVPECRNQWMIPQESWMNGHNPIVLSKKDVNAKYGHEYFDFDKLKY